MRTKTMRSKTMRPKTIIVMATLTALVFGSVAMAQDQNGLKLCSGGNAKRIITAHTQ